VFESWLGAFADRLREAGMDEASARALSVQILSLLEGAFILCRAARSTEALDAAGTAAVTAVAAGLRAAAPTRPRRPSGQ